ncbi:MAG: FkbM family methyltransferase [Ginsengibacter sp.]
MVKKDKQRENRMKGSLKILMLRNKLIGYLLNVTGFIQVCGHWIYRPYINKNSIIIDLGANEGAFSIELYKKYKSHCYAVEPDKNVLNKVIDTNIKKMNYALANINGPVNFYTSYNNEASSIIKGFESNWGNKRIDVVEGITWDSFIDLLNFKAKRINILKVDIEGSELDLIDTFTFDNLSNIEQITVEFHDWLNVSLHERTVASIRKLVSLGFIAVTNTPNHSWPLEILFLNKRLIKLNFFQKLLISLYKRISFLKY